MGEKVYEKDAQSSGDYDLDLGKANTWADGAYELRIESEDSFGTFVFCSYRFLLTDTRTTEMPGPLALWVETDREKAYVGEKVSLIIGSAFRGAHIMLELYRDDEVFLSKNIVLDSAKLVLPIPVTSDLRGGFDYRVSMVREGRLLDKTGNITVPYENRELKIAFTTFRDKLLPGEKETWTLKITRRDGKPVSAEVMASLYDASLDAIYEQIWRDFPEYEKGGFERARWNACDTRMEYGCAGFKYEPECHFPRYSLPDMIGLNPGTFFPLADSIHHLHADPVIKV